MTNLDDLEKWMATDAYRQAVERLRKRSHAGETFTTDMIAHELGLPIEIVTAMALKYLDKPGGFIPVNTGATH